MKGVSPEQDPLDKIIAWGAGQPAVRAMLLTSTHAIPGLQPDRLSDYDVILALRDIQPYHAERGWLEAFGPVLALFRDPLIPDGEFLRSGYVVQFASGLKIDFTLWPLGILRREAAAAQLSDELDAGYRVLLDKDRLTEGLKPPTYRAYIPRPPDAVAYQEAVEVCFLDAIYVAKYLWRDDLIAAKFVMDNFMKHEHLIPMLEWRIEIDHGWSVKMGPYGRGLKKWLSPPRWAQLEDTYTGGGLEANWAALFRTQDLFREVAVEVGDQLGFAYPHDLDRRARAYIEKIRNLERG
jgi:aminoglycoside 6-adenylyltransferase